MTPLQLMKAFLKAKTKDAVEKVRDRAVQNGYTTSFYGGTQENAPAATLASDPNKAISELLLNGVDTVLSMAVKSILKERPINNALEAIDALQWNADILQAKETDFTKERKVGLYRYIIKTPQVGKESRVDVVDRGEGCSAAEWGIKLGSIHGGNKSLKSLSFNLGVHGQGGSAFLKYAKGGALYISRKYGTDEIMIVYVWRLHSSDPSNPLRKSVWMQLDPITVKVADLNLGDERYFDDWEHGTVVRAYDYGYDPYAWGTDRNTPWATIKNSLAGLPLGFDFYDETQNRKDGGAGSNRNVTGGLIGLAYKRSNAIPIYPTEETKWIEVKGETIGIRYWVGPKPEGRKTTAQNWLESNKPVIYTVSGVRHHHSDYGHLLRKCKLTILSGFLVIQIICDNVTTDTLEEIFSSSREVGDERFTAAVYKKLESVLRADDRLKEIAANWIVAGAGNVKAYQKTLDTAVNEILQNGATGAYHAALKSGLGEHLQDINSGKGGDESDPEIKRFYRTVKSNSDGRRTEIELTNEPTRLKFRGNGLIRVPEGAPSTVIAYTDAVNQIAKNIRLEVIGDAPVKASVSQINDGRIHVEVDGSKAKQGDRVIIRLSLKVAGNKKLTTSRGVLILSQSEYTEWASGEGRAKGKQSTKPHRANANMNVTVNIQGIISDAPEWDSFLATGSSNNKEITVRAEMVENVFLIRYNGGYPSLLLAKQSLPREKQEHFDAQLESELAIAAANAQRYQIVMDHKRWILNLEQAIHSALALAK